MGALSVFSTISASLELFRENRLESISFDQFNWTYHLFASLFGETEMFHFSSELELKVRKKIFVSDFQNPTIYDIH